MKKTFIVCIVILISIVLIISMFLFAFYQPKDVEIDNFDLEYSISSNEDGTKIVAKLKNKTGHILKIECVNMIAIEVVEENESFSEDEYQIRRTEYLWSTKTLKKTITAKGSYKARIRSQFVYQGENYVIEKDVAYFKNE